jgi:hypothetical protein
MFFSRVAELIASPLRERLGPFPRRIYSLWIQGEDAAPDLVKLNWNRWARLNPDYDFMILDGETAREKIGPFPIDLDSLSAQAFSDVLRARLLADGGGIWTDASVFPVVPLRDWIDRCLEECTFFAYEAPGADRPISSWFLAARERSLIMRLWWEAIRTYWAKPRVLALDEAGQWRIPDDPAEAVAPHGGGEEGVYYYFWFHYLFAYLCADKPAFRNAWARCSHKSAMPPHRLQGVLHARPDLPFGALAKEARSAEVQKLSWRASYPLELLARL